MRADFGFDVGSWNQAYQFATLPRKLDFDQVAPGDLLFVPPYWWHTVETLSPSLSLSTLSRWPQLYNHMNALYTHEYFFDALASHEARQQIRQVGAQQQLRADLPDLLIIC